jgi:beta-glucanase (GH16 family)
MTCKKKLQIVTQIIILCTFSILITGCGSESDDSGDENDWTITWQDEFDGTSVNTGNWNFNQGNGYDENDGWGNGELQYYTGYQRNLRVDNGSLKITAIKESYNGFNYTSARINTQNKFSQTNGKFEARIKMPVGQGYWPAFWLLPQDSPYGEWPASGEIDILESKGSQPNWASASLHFGAQNDRKYITYSTDNLSTPISEYHVYSLVWEEDTMYWYIDDALYAWESFWFSKTNDGTYYPFPAPFDNPFYIVLNLAIGGSFDGNPDETTQFPQTMEVDYVRVYEKTE